MMRKKHFILDKILNLYKPEIYYKFVDNYLSTNIYSTPWFVTVFSNISGVFSKKDDASKFVMMVIENFIIDGWSAVFNTGFTLINFFCPYVFLNKNNTFIYYV